MSLLEKLDVMSRRHAELTALLGQADTLADTALFTRLSKEFGELSPLAEAYQDYRGLDKEIAETGALINDPDSGAEMREMAREELEELKIRLEKEWQALRLMLLPADPHAGKNVILEIRAGTGGDEAGLFAADLFRMYGRYVETRGWRMETLSTSVTPLGGLKEVTATVTGKGAYPALKFESGVHRVQRVPTTETGGRIHTSACTVAILPEATEVDIRINEKEDLRIDVFRASGPGGQSVNTTDSAIRITHLASGLVVICQDEKSQLKNKLKALKVLKARLYDLEQRAADDERSRERRDQVGSGDRSERIRTYNFPQGRVTDHRINLTLHKLEQVLQGDLEEIISSLSAHYQAELLARMGGEMDA